MLTYWVENPYSLHYRYAQLVGDDPVMSLKLEFSPTERIYL